MDSRNGTEEEKSNEGTPGSAFERMGRNWLGLGNLDSPCWFIGMEPGGAEDASWPDIWATRFDGAAVIDLHAAAGDAEERYLGPNNRLHPTWSPIVRLRLAYAGLPAEDSDVLRYQREQFCSGGGGEALLEISAYAAKNLEVAVPREHYLESRIARLRDLIRERAPEIVVCYGIKYSKYYEQICGGPLVPNVPRWTGLTCCILIAHPKPRMKAPRPPQYWIDLGVALRKNVDQRPSKTSAA